MIDDSNPAPDPDIRELSLDEIDATSEAGLVAWLKSIFGGDAPSPSEP